MPAGKPPRAGDVKPIVLRQLRQLMERQGFAFFEEQEEFKKEFPNGKHSIAVFSKEERSHCEFHLNVANRFHALSELRDAIFPVPEDRRNDYTLFCPRHGWIDDFGDCPIGPYRQYRIQAAHEIGSILRHLCSKVETRLLPMLEQFQTIEGLDAVMNPDPVSASPYFFSYDQGEHHILAAYLARNPRLYTLCDEFESKAKDRQFMARMIRCIEYVRAQRGI